MSRNEKWTFEVRDLFYSMLVARFGSHEEWEAWDRPGRGLDDQFDAFCERFAELVGATSINAVKQQLAFSTPLPPGHTRRWAPGHARTAILNIAAAFKAGFVGNDAFPSLVASGPADGELTEEVAPA
ncbi:MULTISPECIES: hypothetical protein [unclassified Bradyrhizobium]|uniref:hypothetical protein n=1 Tax=unclassified Bradyrhizobium TaxID=2631580 RepID=UPI001FF85CF5|nr:MULTISPECIES: hypothetical protein [unclassified Bradyrhizobium]MCK1715882.1 hypothetical protein [Bradyrhizobium sp. 143]MCK1724145.1 hypothetical protein [Bradyrhizobium sp. 142]